MGETLLCIPNFSEGRHQGVIGQITDTIEHSDGIMLLDVDPGQDTNRTVVTFGGPPDAVGDAAFQAIAKAAELIDMSTHTGNHARMGATDVCPFVPISGVTVEQCVRLAQRLGRRVGDELGIPVYLYGYAASRPERKVLADIRTGEYEALSEKMRNPDFAPDFGPPEFNARSGATVIGVRDLLLAYNVNLDTPDVQIAKQIAMTIRHTGRVERDDSGEIVRDEVGQPLRIPGKLKACQAAGWFVKAYGCAQVTINLPDYAVTGLHTAFEAVRQEAEALGASVTGSELVGLAPKQAIVDAGRFYLAKQGAETSAGETEIIQAAIDALGLNDKAPFDPNEKIVECRLGQ
ncbi:MAG: glutamate formimidoyltransferase [Planctomycetota bacterium]